MGTGSLAGGGALVRGCGVAMEAGPQCRGRSKGHVKEVERPPAGSDAHFRFRRRHASRRPPCRFPPALRGPARPGPTRPYLGAAAGASGARGERGAGVARNEGAVRGKEPVGGG